MMRSAVFIRGLSAQLPRLLICMVMSAVIPVIAGAASVQVLPEQSGLFIGKKPEVRADFDTPLNIISIYVLLDNMDITALVQITDHTINYNPPIPLYGGWHEVAVQGLFQDGQQIDFGWSFQVKHTEKFDEVSLGTDLTAVYSRAMKFEEVVTTQPDWKFEAIGPSVFTLIKGNKGLSLEGTAYYLQQDDDPDLGVMEEGADLRDFRLTGTWVGSKGTGELKVGDLNVTETQLVNPGLNRRGIHFTYATQQTGVSVYSLGATPLFGLRHGMKLSVDPDESVLGSSVRWMDKDGKIGIHVAYLTGTEDLSGSLASAGSGVASEGDALGVALSRVFAAGKVSGFFEGAISNYDPDITDTEDKSRDQALSAGATWRASSKLDYTLQVQRIGADFTSIGNTGATQNIENISLSNGIHFENHNINLLLYFAQDNLEGDTVIPTSQFMKVEAFDQVSLSPNLAAGLLVYHESLDTEDEPSGFIEERSSSDHGTIDLSFSRPTWNMRSVFSTTSTDVRSGLTTDTKQTETRLDLAFFPSRRFNLSLTLPQIITREVESGADTDSLLASFQLNAIPFGDALTISIAGSLSDTQTSDDSLDMTVTEYSARLAYSLRKYFPAFAVPRLALGGNVRRTKDRILGSDDEEYRIYVDLELLSSIRL